MTCASCVRRIERSLSKVEGVRQADVNLAREGVPKEKIIAVGNVMIDTLVRHMEMAKRSSTLRELSLERGRYALVTLHRPSNVDHEPSLRAIMEALAEIACRVPVVFPVHPRTRKRLEALDRGAGGVPSLRLTEPLGYLEFLQLMMNAQLVLTDSGGIQEETTFLGVPCLTLRENTERWVTVNLGTNRLVGTDTRKIIDESRQVLDGKRPAASVPPLWDGQAARRIVEALLERSDAIKQSAG
jgi:UDP-N-acetylglucosamine 2-epimerase (non-hydrolysing)